MNAMDIVPVRFRNLTYSEKLRDPRWLERRRQKITGHPFCDSCRRRDTRLAVHHIAYHAGMEPWDYPENELRVLCAACHEQMHEVLQFVKTDLFGFLNVNEAESLAVNLKLLVDIRGPREALACLHALNRETNVTART